MMQGHVSVDGIMQRIVPITRFNKGEANKIFDEVRQSGTKVVLKNNDPVCVLVDPKEYESMIEKIMDYELAMEAERRLAADSGKTFAESEVMEELGITEADLDGVEVEIE